MRYLKLLLILPLMLTPGSPWIMKWMALYQARKNLGRDAPRTADIDGDTHFPQLLYYFHAPYCGPCKAMMPMIDQLREVHPNLIKVDVVEHEQLAAEFGVSATPVFVVVRNDRVIDVKVGAQRRPWILSNLAEN